MVEQTRVNRLADLKRFYDLLDALSEKLGGMQTLATMRDHRDWPTRGVYFFFDPTEPRRDSGHGPRVVRVGTHAISAGSKSTLRQRLAQHRGNSSGGGNHRGSIFRLLVGQALLATHALPPCPSWGVKADKRQATKSLGIERHTLDANEAPVELAVSRYLWSLPVIWLAVEDAPSATSQRQIIEHEAIALLSNHTRPPIDPATEDWLGHHSFRPMVRESGLWNQRSTRDAHNPSFLDAMEQLML